MRRPSRLTLVRKALAAYIQTEGCSCCRDIDGHKEAEQQLARLLRVPKYKDGSGYDWSRVK